MIDRIKKHLDEREAINKSLSNIIKHIDDDEDSPIEIFEGDWEVDGDTLHLQHLDEPIEEDFYSFTISSLGTKSVDLYMGERDGYTYVMAYVEDGSWDDTTIFVLDNKNKK